jgi:hypothetical protein
MSSFSTYLEQEIVNFLKGTNVDTAPTSLLLALSTADPVDDKSGIAEPSAMGYARKTIVLGSLSSVNGTGTTVTGPTSDTIFGPATGSWGSITHWAIFENAGTNMLLHGSITAAKTVGNGDSFVVNANSLSIVVR